MEMNGEELINASRSAVWAALNDPEILKQAIPGCQSVERDSDTSFKAIVKIKVGPVKATFKGQVTLSNIDEPNGYTITGEGKGGVAGFGKGGADITLSDVDGGTLLSYNVKASVGGKMAQIGSRLIDSTAKKLARDFFSTFNTLVSTSQSDEDTPLIEEPVTTAKEPTKQEAVVTSEPKAAQTTPAQEEQKSGWMKPSVLVPAAIVAILVLYFLSNGS
ncbi:MAG: carbon monoxide dehydrogenase subunit G [Sneathiella sp.]|nr:carbon monoxide dehydrogenase subunit G [Sneathiella sp.]